jgi:hypothetical protein
MAEYNEPLFCAVHPRRETSLRCNRCEKPICSQCAVLTPTGYRCQECVRSQRKVFDTVQWYDYPISFVTAGVLAYIGSYLVSWIGFFTILLAPVVGTIIAEAVRFLVKKRRGKWLFQLAAVGIVLGSMPRLLPPLILLLLGGGTNLNLLLSLLWPTIYTIIATSTAYYRLSGIRIG